jgi:hypothetical protein
MRGVEPALPLVKEIASIAGRGDPRDRARLRTLQAYVIGQKNMSAGTATRTTSSDSGRPSRE